MPGAGRKFMPLAYIGKNFIQKTNFLFFFYLFGYQKKSNLFLFVRGRIFTTTAFASVYFSEVGIDMYVMIPQF